MYKLLPISVFSFLIFTTKLSAGNFETIDGGALYLKRFGVETLRAEFTSAADCRLIAKNMRAAEQRSHWFCSTSEAPITFNCNLNKVTVINTDKGTQSTTGKFEFKITLNRGKANSEELSPAISSFDYEYSKPYLMLTNDYLYVDGNYFSRAITKLRLNRETGKLVALDINMSPNGSGDCHK